MDPERRRRRNDRDRKRTQAKKEELKDMRRLVQDLEQQKKELTEKEGANAAKCLPESRSIVPMETSSAETEVTVQAFLGLSADVEAVRLENANLTEQIVERDLLYSVLRTGLLEFSQDKRGKDDKQFRPLTHEEGVACVHKTLHYINNARLLYANEANFQDRPTIFGWRQYCKRQGAFINFAVKKSLPNVTPRHLANTTWRFALDSDVLNSLGPTQIKAKVTILQKITDDLVVLDRRTEDRTRQGADGKMLVLRTIYIAFRFEGPDGSQTIALKTISRKLVQRMLRVDEVWCDIFYWMHYALEDAVDEDSGARMTASEFGGANTYASEEFASSWLEEVLFLATRWETLVFPPRLDLK